ncbi:MAG: 2Fe-2S iron-sulfur cluster-binding protein [Caulobacteraceae bacterium]
MRLTCPFCGDRDAEEFSILGEAAPPRPDPGAPDAEARFVDYVYLRDKPGRAAPRTLVSRLRLPAVAAGGARHPHPRDPVHRPGGVMSAPGGPGRLPTGGLIDRDRPLNFRFDGRSMQGFAGDTLASALLANGVGLVGRSFKYHRPRGVMTAGVRGAQRPGRAPDRRPARAQHQGHNHRAL